MEAYCDIKKLDYDNNDIYTMSMKLPSTNSLTSTSLEQTLFVRLIKIVISPTNNNIFRYEINLASKGVLDVMKRIYLLLGLIGVLIELLSLISIFVVPIIDPNIAKVLMPMGIAYLLMIMINYFIRRKEYE